VKKLLTVVIPCKNEGNQILKTLQSIKSDIDIIVADSSTDDTLNYIPQTIKIVDGGLPSVARNKGAESVTTPYILFLDADTDISKIPLDTLLDDFIKKEYHLATVTITVDTWHKLFYKIFHITQHIISFKNPFATGGFMLFKTEIFKALGGFNERDKFAEDFHLSMKIHPNRFKIYPHIAITSNRRLKNKGIFYMMKLMIKCWFNRNDENFYTKDYNYWK